MRKKDKDTPSMNPLLEFSCQLLFSSDQIRS